MEKRDLLVDLEWVQAGGNPLTIGDFIMKLTAIAEHSLKRAIAAEALVRELVDVLEEIKKRGDWLKRDCTESDKVMSYAIDINLIGNGVLAKAKEALGDDRF